MQNPLWKVGSSRVRLSKYDDNFQYCRAVNKPPLIYSKGSRLYCTNILYLQQLKSFGWQTVSVT